MKCAICCLMIFSFGLLNLQVIAQAAKEPGERIVLDEKTPSLSAMDAHRMLAEDSLNQDLILIFNRKMPRLANEFFEYVAMLSKKELNPESRDLLKASLMDLFGEADSIQIVVIHQRNTQVMDASSWIEFYTKQHPDFNPKQVQPASAKAIFSLTEPEPVTNCYKYNKEEICLTFTLLQKPKNFGREVLTLWDVYITGVRITVR